MARELYVYWRVRDGALADARAAVQQMQAELCRSHPGLAARRLLRQGDADTTLMEIYTCAPRGVDAALQAQIESAALVLAPFCNGARHIEAFEDAAS